ncbi:unnamed protein product [Cercospora beticola]|nr:unnamed protein product [Cercospora beticola]
MDRVVAAQIAVLRAALDPLSRLQAFTVLCETFKSVPGWQANSPQRWERLDEQLDNKTLAAVAADAELIARGEGQRSTAAGTDAVGRLRNCISTWSLQAHDIIRDLGLEAIHSGNFMRACAAQTLLDTDGERVPWLTFARAVLHEAQQRHLHRPGRGKSRTRPFLPSDVKNAIANLQQARLVTTVVSAVRSTDSPRSGRMKRKASPNATDPSASQPAKKPRPAAADGGHELEEHRESTLPLHDTYDSDSGDDQREPEHGAASPLSPPPIFVPPKRSPPSMTVRSPDQFGFTFRRLRDRRGFRPTGAGLISAKGHATPDALKARSKDVDDLPLLNAPENRITADDGATELHANDDGEADDGATELHVNDNGEEGDVPATRPPIDRSPASATNVLQHDEVAAETQSGEEDWEDVDGDEGCTDNQDENEEDAESESAESADGDHTEISVEHGRCAAPTEDDDSSLLKNIHGSFLESAADAVSHLELDSHSTTEIGQEVMSPTASEAAMTEQESFVVPGQDQPCTPLSPTPWSFGTVTTPQSAVAMDKMSAVPDMDMRALIAQILETNVSTNEEPPSSTANSMMAFLQPGRWLSITTVSNFISALNPDSSSRLVLENGFLRFDADGAAHNAKQGRQCAQRRQQSVIYGLLNHNSHYMIAILDRNSKTIELYDSLHPRPISTVRRAVLEFASGFHTTGSGSKEWQIVAAPGLRQGNGYDCGVYAAARVIFHMHERLCPEYIIPEVWRRAMSLMSTVHEPSSAVGDEIFAPSWTAERLAHHFGLDLERGQDGRLTWPCTPRSTQQDLETTSKLYTIRRCFDALVRETSLIVEQVQGSVSLDSTRAHLDWLKEMKAGLLCRELAPTFLRRQLSSFDAQIAEQTALADKLAAQDRTHQNMMIEVLQADARTYRQLSQDAENSADSLLRKAEEEYVAIGARIKALREARK